MSKGNKPQKDDKSNMKQPLDKPKEINKPHSLTALSELHKVM